MSYMSFPPPAFESLPPDGRRNRLTGSDLAVIDDWMEKMQAQGFESAILHDGLSPEVCLMSNLVALRQIWPGRRIWALARVNEVIYVWRSNGTVIAAAFNLDHALAAVGRDAYKPHATSASA